jgi:hypothetical protein
LSAGAALALLIVWPIARCRAPLAAPADGIVTTQLRGWRIPPAETDGVTAGPARPRDRATASTEAVVPQLQTTSSVTKLPQHVAGELVAAGQQRQAERGDRFSTAKI